MTPNLFAALACATLSLASSTLAQGDDDRRILVPRHPAISPDGQQIAFAWRGDIWVSSASGGEAHRVTTHPGDDDYPMFHPDGERLAFTSSRGGNRQIYFVTLPDGAPEQVTHGSLGKRLIGFANDGKDMVVAMRTDEHFHYSESQRVYLIDVAGERGKRLLFDSGCSKAALSPDGSKVLFTRGRTSWWRKGFRGASAEQLWLADLATTPAKLTRISEDREGFQNVAETDPMWAPDGKGYYFLSDPDGTFDIYYRALAGGQARRVTNVSAADGSDDGIAFPALSQDGSAMIARRLFELVRIDPRNDEVAKIELVAAGDRFAHERERRTESSAATVAFTHDGKQMAFVAGEDVYVMDRVLKEPVRVTTTPSRETDLVFSKDGRTLWFISDAGGEMDLWSVACPHEDGIWWLAEAFEPAQVTDDREVERALRLSPDGETLFLTRDHDLYTMPVAGGTPTLVLETWSGPSYDISPDGKWVCYSTQDDDYNSDVWVAPVDRSRSPFNISRHPARDGQPVWSGDGKRIAFTGTRGDGETDVYYVNLEREVEEQTERDRKLEEALAAMKKSKPGKGKKGDRSKGKRGKAGAEPDTGGDAVADADAEKGAGEPAAEATDEDDDEKKVAVAIEFDGLLDRIHRISIPDSRESGLIFAPDGKKLLFSATIDNKRGIYAVEFPKVGKPKKVADSGLSGAVWLKEGNQIVGLASGGSSPGAPSGRRRFFRGGGGTPAAMSAAGKVERFEFAVREERDWTELRQLAFDQGWRAMRDRFYDPKMNNRDWNAVRAKYRPAAASCLGRAEFNDLMNLMLGELNASHMGHSGGDEPLPRPSEASAWSPTTYHLGLRFGTPTDRGFPVTSVIPGGPTSQARSLVAAGETLRAVDGERLTATSDLDALLTMDQARDVELVVAAADGTEREVTVRPVSSVAGLLYDEWVDDTRAKVDELSGNKLGYLHIRGMNMGSLRQMEEDIYAAGHGKDGLIIDVRFNGGGSTADRVMTILTQPVHAITQSRGSGEGYPVDRKVYASWGKPIVLMCNEHSFSNAEILSHAVKQLGRGRVVGMRTGGGVISTGSVSLVDGSRVRMPMRGWYLVSTGEDMELNGCLPDLPLWNEPNGPDAQLQRAVKALAEDVEAERQRGRPDIVPAAAKRLQRGAVPAGASRSGGGR